MKDATMRQGNRLLELVLSADDPSVFVQNLIERWGAVRLIGEGKLAQAELVEALQYIETRNPYATEMVEPRFFYPEGYKPNTVEEQVRRLLDIYDWLDASQVEALATSWGEYAQADGLYVVPKPTVLAERLGIEDPWVNFGRLTEVGPLAALSSQRKLTNYRVGQMEADRYRLIASAKAALMRLEEEQEGDLLVFPAQTGQLFAGRRPDWSRWEIEHASAPSQWPLPAYVVGWMLIGNPHRLERYEHLVIDCPGDEYRFERDEQFGCILYFRFGDEKLCVDDRWSYRPSVCTGSASAFFQQ